jgi:hypothetical protein
MKKILIATVIAVAPMFGLMPLASASPIDPDCQLSTTDIRFLNYVSGQPDSGQLAIFNPSTAAQYSTGHAAECAMVVVAHSAVGYLAIAPTDAGVVKAMGIQEKNEVATSPAEAMAFIDGAVDYYAAELTSVVTHYMGTHNEIGNF